MARLIVLSLLAAASVAAAAEDFQVTMTATEPTGVLRQGELISGGVPLPRGQFAAGQAFAVFDRHGKEIPCQVETLSMAPDETLQWVLVSLVDDIEARTTKRYVLRAKTPSAKPPAAVKVTHGDGGVTIDTGATRFRIAAYKPFGLLTEAWAGDRKVVAGGKAFYTDAFDGKSYLADKPSSIDVESAGPVRATVCIRGRFAGDEANRFQYVARITAWAGSSRLVAKYSLCNSNPEHYAWRAVKESAVELDLAEQYDATTVGVGATDAHERVADRWIAAGLRAKTPGAVRVGSGADKGQALAPIQGGVGWLAAHRSAGGVQVCDLYFADDPPRKLAVRKGRLTLAGAIERWRNDSKDKNGREIGAPWSATVRALPDCSHFSSHYVLDLDATSDSAKLRRAAAAAAESVHLAAEPSVYLHDDALPIGPFATQTDELACYDRWGWGYDKNRVPSAPGRTVGRYIRGIDNHYEPEEDCLDQLLLMYLRTGKRVYFDQARAWANYWTDLYPWRTDGWAWKDGGVWWGDGPQGNRPQRPADPVTQRRNVPVPWAKEFKPPLTKEIVEDLYFLSNSKSCYCHNWGQGLLTWYCLTGDRDALEAMIDRVEQDLDTQRRAFGKVPGKANSFSRDFTRSSYNAHALRMIAPDLPVAVEASEFLAKVYLARPAPEPRGLVNAAGPTRRIGDLLPYVGERGLAEMKRLGHTYDPKTGQMTDPKTGRTWYVIHEPHTWMLPPLSRAMDLYHRLTGDEDAMDWTIAYGQAAARVLYQDHGLLTYGKMLADFPARGVVKDRASWTAPPESTRAEGLTMSGFLARFHPDVCARAYALCGEELLKQRAYDYWNAGSHRGYQRKENYPFDRVGM